MKTRNFMLAVLLLIPFIAGFGQVKVQNLLTEDRIDPIGLDLAQPRFSWQLLSVQRNVMQTAYELRVSDNIADLSKKGKLVWESKKVSSDSSAYVAYKGPALRSGTRYFWQVRVWDNRGKASEWSQPAFWQTAFLSTNEWKAKWIMQDTVRFANSEACPVFRRTFIAGKQIQSATAYITALGMYEAQINGARLGDAFFTPGWTAYRKRIQYQVYDVTGIVKQGNNAIGVTLGNGWYSGFIGWGNHNHEYGKYKALLFQLEINYTDGTSETIVSDESWKSSTGSIKYSEIYHGETIDNRVENTGWTLSGYDDAAWVPVNILSAPNADLVATYNEPVREHEQFKPIKTFKTPSGEQVIDFGQNLVGFVKVKLSGKKGDTITIRHAEILDKSGNFYTENLRAAKATDVYILKGNGIETFEPHFTFHGFRYIKIDGLQGEINPDDFTAVALYSDMKPTGTFTSSNSLINQLQHNIQWGQKGNFVDVPTDCPQRDERLGWAGDAQAFSRTATFNMDVHNFFVKWLKDLALDQLPNGSVPHVIPNVLGPKSAGSTGWADVATIAPMNMYLAYGDKRILVQQYNSMKAWVDYMTSQSKNNLWNTGYHFGDWLFYSPSVDDAGRAAVTNKYLIAQCFWAHSTQLLIDAATILGKTEDISHYSALLNSIKEAFNKEYVTPNGGLVSGTQTAYVLALQFDMLPENLRSQAVDRLVQDIDDYDNHLTTGFLGTPYLCHVLSRFGKADVAYRLLLQETYPSWLYPVKMGATTIWERWDGIKPDGTLQTPGMNSFNHYAYGAIGDWMYREVAGINTETDGAGYKKIRIQPYIEKGLTHASASLMTNYGTVSSSWKSEDGKLIFNVEIPVNTTASIFIPAKNAAAIMESGTPLSAVKELKVTGSENGFVTVKSGSGKYQFTVNQ
ncbi:MAG: family 78 glycoside hydrolase catalytic domain [Bacteroidales bacterium]|nr:family 78 glycoside hydrolase catalytic domain [Bacteroidales bacterium]